MIPIFNTGSTGGGGQSDVTTLRNISLTFTNLTCEVSIIGITASTHALVYYSDETIAIAQAAGVTSATAADEIVFTATSAPTATIVCDITYWNDGAEGNSSHIIKNSSGTIYAQRANLQFGSGFTVSDDSTNDATVVALGATTIPVDGTLQELKARKISLDLKDYATYSASLSTGFGGQYLSYSLSNLKNKQLLTDFSVMLNVSVVYWSAGWRTTYSNGRIFLDGQGTTITIVLGTNWVNESCVLTLMVLGY